MLAPACAHCGAALTGAVTDASALFCCAGCRAAYGLVQGLGLGAYYQRRALDPAARPPRPEPDAIMADVCDFARPAGDGLWRLDLLVDGAQCAACVWLVESVLGRQPGVVGARLNLTLRRLAITWRGPTENAAVLAAVVAGLGYRVTPFDPLVADATAARADADLLRALAAAGFAAANVMLLSVAVWSGQATVMGPATLGLLHWLSAVIAIPAVGYAGRPFFRSALAALRHGRTNMDVPISIGILLAAGMSLFETLRGGPHVYFDSTVTLLFFLLIGRFLDARARGKARAAMGHVLSLQARAVRVQDADGAIRLLPPAKVRPGDRVLVAAGERLPVDGRVIDGHAAIDASLITGEAMPVAAAPGVAVLAGTLNLSGPLTLAATAVGEATVLGDIVRLVEVAEAGRGRQRALADRVARRYAPVVHGLAALTFLGWWGVLGAPWQAALLNAVAVLIITCPCALALAVPAVQVAAAGRLSRAGVLLKAPTALERLAEADWVVFDKTGTLTLGRPVPILAGVPADALALAAGLAATSSHPLARALARAVPDAVAMAGVREVPGAGLVVAGANGDVRLGSRAFCGVPDDGRATAMELWLARPDHAAQRIPFADDPRPDAAATVVDLAATGYGVELLSGDRAAAVAAVARTVGLDAWRAAVDPAGKVARLAALAGEGRRVLMVGDGLNDAPALAAAHVSMSPTSAADISQTAADVLFQGDRLGAVTLALATARRAARLVRQNLVFALAYNALAVPLAMAGLVTPLLAAAAMSSSSLVVMANALRLSAGRRP